MGQVFKLFLRAFAAVASTIAICSCSISGGPASEAEPLETLEYGLSKESAADLAQFSELMGSLGKRMETVIASIDEAERRKQFSHIQPDETGSVMIIMFHNFVEEYVDGENTSVTTTLSEFRRLLETLYADGYRTTSLSEFISGSIAVQSGCKPIIFTFDDGRPTQFSLIENPDGSFSEDTKTAVYEMERFYKEHPDFGLNGTFFLNLGYKGTFGTVGTLKQRLEAIAAKGFELENHSFNHANLAALKTSREVEKEIGANVKLLRELLPGRTMSAFALPYGNTSKEFEQYIERGSYEGVTYNNKGILLVGAEPAKPMYLKEAPPLKIRRILASGITPVELDFDWWYKAEKHEFISDGNPDTIAVPLDKVDLIDKGRLEQLGKKMVVIGIDE